MTRAYAIRRIAALILIAAAASGRPCLAQQKEGLVGWWRFDDPGGFVAEDASGQANDADIWGAKWAQGPFGTALWFDGESSYLSVPQLPGLDGSEELTVTAWVYWEEGGRYPNIITGGTWSPGGFLIFVSDRTCRFRMGRPGHRAHDPQSQWREQGVTLISGFELDRWYHLAATFKRPEITTYVNGEKVASAQWDYPVGYSGELLIGRWGEGRAHHKGLIDDVRIYTRALRPEEVAAVHQAGSEGRVAAGGDEDPYEIMPDQEQVAPIMATLGTDDFELALSERGRAVSLTERRTGRDLLDAPTPIAWARVDDRILRRVRCSWEPQSGRLNLTFGADEVRAVIGVRDMGGYLALEVLEADAQIEQLGLLQLRLQSLPLRNPMSGVVADDEVGVCMRALNIDTHVLLGGDPPTLSARAYSDYGLVGARAGLVACPTSELRSRLKELVRREEVPMSSLGGPWSLDAETNRGSYLFARVSESNVEEWIALAKRGGFTHVHFSGWWQTRGHYEPSESLFPSGLEGMRECVRRIHAAGLKAGMHTLTGCIQPSDPWVTPVPDPRLAADATYTLARPMDEDSDAIYTVEKPGDHDTIWSYSGSGNVIRIGEELIHYAAISREEPYGFLECTRGAFGTSVSEHPEGATADHLRQRYLAFYPDESSTLVGEVADRIARVYNQCEFDQIYMDGAEGIGSRHAIDTMRTAIYERLNRPALVEASSWGHWNWYYHSRVGAWDHPKWALKQFTDMHCEQLPYYRQAGLLQAQLGWWVVLGPGSYYDAETPDEMEYFCAKILANDAPMSVQGVGAIGRPANARMREYLTMTGQYERLRLAGYFDEAVLRRLRRPGRDHHLHQASEGEWELIPRDFHSHTVTGLDDGSDAWIVPIAEADQPARLRIKALYDVADFDAEGGVLVADFSDLDRFDVRASAQDVRQQLAAPDDAAGQRAAVTLAAANEGESRRGAWTKVGRRFEPHLDMKGCDALGVWVHGDGRGELLNIQLANPREYSRALADNFVVVDFEGWRYVELPLRERDPRLYRQHVWPYRGQHPIFRNRLVRNHVSELSIYLNNVPPGETASVHLGPIRALPTAAVSLDQPRLTINGEDVTLPVSLHSESYVEVDPDGAWRLYDRRCDLQQRGRLDGPTPASRTGLNSLAFSSATEAARAEVTVIADGQPLRGKAADGEIDWSALRYEYVPPRIVTALDGRQNTWDVVCRQGLRARLGAEIIVEQSGGSPAAYEDPSALTVESFDELSFFADSPENEFTKYVHDAEHSGIATKPGVTQQFERSTDIVKVGEASARYTATSTRTDSAGWSARGRRFAETLDLTGYRGVGMWVHGDAGGHSIKFQLRDTEGRWHDMVRRVDFTGWRYLEFDLAGADLDLSAIEYLIIYYNAIPAGQTVTCYVDDVRALPVVEAVRNPSLSIGDQRVTFPVSLAAGDRLRWDGGRRCVVRRSVGGRYESVPAEGSLLSLRPGVTPAAFDVEEAGEGFRVEVALVKDYGG
ncbi:MAG: LamG-like jellyroll fold domain-containing protein [Armatimonadota bacterium]|nr:LamG-like jellyroll fold domain-containing protein [Armatimonadota bacterium]